LRAENDGFEAGGADFVDSCADGRLGEAGVDGALAGWVLAETVMQGGQWLALEKGLMVVMDGMVNFAERTLPKKTSSTSVGLIPERSTAALFQRFSLH
jgi:hypothetical protein